MSIVKSYNDGYIMRKYKFAWCCLGFTMLMPLFIVEHIGIYLVIGIIISVLLFVVSSANWNEMPQITKTIDDVQNNYNFDDDKINNPIYCYCESNIYYDRSDD